MTLLDKPDRRMRPVEVKYVGFRIPDEFVVGYGLDLRGRVSESAGRLRVRRVEGNEMSCGRSGIPAEPEGNRTGRKVFCVKFQREMPGLDEAPFDNELGQKIYDTVSKEAWKIWVEQMKMIMNEYRLNLSLARCAAVLS